MNIENSTTIAAAKPIAVTEGRPAMTSPVMAMTTVMPANSTDCPAVALATPAASSTDIPSWRCWRWRVTTNSA